MIYEKNRGNIKIGITWSNQIVQIFDTHPNDVGLHWICFSKFNSDDDVVNLYDSADVTNISSAAEMAIANMMFSPIPKIFVRHFKCSVETNTNDCGFTPLQIWLQMELILVAYHILSLKWEIILSKDLRIKT